MILHLGGIVMRTDDSYTQKFTKQVVRPTRRYFHPLYRGTWFPTGKEWNARAYVFVSIRYIAVLGFQRRHRPSQLPWCSRVSIRYIAVLGFQQEGGDTSPHASLKVSIRYIAVLGFQHYSDPTFKQLESLLFPSAISRYLVSNPYNMAS